MGLDGYVGSAEDSRRIRRQEKQREEQKKKFEDLKKQSDANVDAAGLRQFGTAKSEVLEAAFKNETVGLVTRDEFVNKRNTLQRRIEEQALQAKRAAEASAEQEKEERKKKKARLTAKVKLSFDAEDDGDADDEEVPAHPQTAGGHEDTSRSEGGAGKVGKDPTVETDFLPDRERERQEQDMRDQLKQEYLLRQQIIQNEPLQVTYSYWDGTGRRRQTTCRKGDTISQFLAKVRAQLATEFRELRSTSVDDLMYIKEDLILPHHVTFYSLITNKARGKSGPLFHFDVHEDVRSMHDASKEKDESHAGKIVDRHWYNRNKHIFPASRWELWDPDKSYDRYTIHG